MYATEEDAKRYNVGIEGSHLMTSFQCDLCIFRTLFKRDPKSVRSDVENLMVIRRMNLDSIWSREPSTIQNNRRNLAKIIKNCEARGFEPQLPALGPCPFEDTMGFSVAFSMLLQSRQKGRHSKSHTQFATIRQQRAAFTNLYLASAEAATLPNSVTNNSQTKFLLGKCPTNSIWYQRWSKGCETRMGYVIKQDRALSIDLLLEMIKVLSTNIACNSNGSKSQLSACMLLVYITISFTASLRGNEGMKLDFGAMMRHFEEGKDICKTKSSATVTKPHVIIPLRGRFKGESGERCHLLPLINVTKSGIHIRETLNLFVMVRQHCKLPNNGWGFVNIDGSKMSFQEMNELFTSCIEFIQSNDTSNKFKLDNTDVREEYSINRSCRRGSTTHAQNQGISSAIIQIQNRWSTAENAKGRRPKFNMLETYSEIRDMVPAMLKYSEQL